MAVRFHCRILAVVLFILFVIQPAAAGTFRLRVLTYNCGGATYLDLTPRGIQQIADEIVNNRVDIAGLTEMDLGTSWWNGRDLVAEVQVALAARGYAMQVFHTQITPYMDGQVVHGLLSRWPIRKFDNPIIDDTRGWKLDHITVEPYEGFQFDVVQSHFPVGLAGNEPELQRVLDYVNESSNPRMLLGDLNIVYGNQFFETAAKAGLLNTCTLANNAPCPSGGKGGATAVAPYPFTGQIDHILVSGDVRVVRSYTNLTSMSDHWPVIADLELPAPDGAPELGENIREPKPALVYDGAMDAWRKGDYSAAAERFEAIRDDAKDRGEEAYFLFAQGVMHQKNSDRANAEATFRLLSRDYAETYWGTKAMVYLAVMLEEQGQFAEALKENDKFVAGYYEYIHPYPLDTTINACLERWQSYRANLNNPPANATEFFTELAAKYEGKEVARAANYQLAMRHLRAGSIEEFKKHYPLAKADPANYLPNVPLLKEITLALARIGEYEQADIFFNTRLMPRTGTFDYQRNMAGRYWRLRYPEFYDIQLKRGFPKTIDLAGERHVLRISPSDDPPSGRVLFLADPGNLNIHIEVEDAHHFNEAAGAEIWRGDSLQMAIDPDASGGGTYDPGDSEFGVALTKQGHLMHAWKTGEGANFALVRATAVRQGNKTVYDISMPFSAMGVADINNPRFGLSFLVNDDDGNGRTSLLELTPGMAYEKAPEMYPVFTVGN